MLPLDWHAAEYRRLVAAKLTLPHALLLRGPRGVGKLAFARALAQALLCEALPASGAACGQCSSCSWFVSGTHPDYRQIEPATTPSSAESDEAETKKATVISVQQIRELPGFINVSSHRGGLKVVVIHPAEALNVNAANALLKSLEEPPPNIHFLLVTHRPHQLLPTIRSRCQQVVLPAPDTAMAIEWLGAQGIREPEVALAHVGGAPLMALELHDTEYWGARSAFMRHLTVRDMDVLTASEAVRDFPIPHVIAWLQKWSYDLAHHRALGKVRYNPDYADALAQAVAQMDRLAVLRFHREMVKMQRIANHPLNPRLLIEHVLFAYRDLTQSPPGAA